MSTNEKYEALVRGMKAELQAKQGEVFDYAFAYFWTVSITAQLLAKITSPIKAERDQAKAEIRALAKLGGL